MAIKNLINYISFLLIHSFVFIKPLLAHEGATGIIKERMDKFKMSKKNDANYSQVYSKRRF